MTDELVSNRSLAAGIVASNQTGKMNVQPNDSHCDPRPAVVFKVGGSLLDLPDLPERLRQVFALRQPSRPLLVVGGGQAADIVREWDRNFALGSEAAHDLAIESMGLNVELLLHLMPELQLVRSLPQFRMASTAKRPAIVCAKCFMKWLDQRPERLPHDWTVTSDSIAAAVTRHWDAVELILLKSDRVPDGSSVSSLANTGFLDSHFSRIAEQAGRVSVINLRIQPFLIQTLVENNSA